MKNFVMLWLHWTTWFSNVIETQELLKPFLNLTVFFLFFFLVSFAKSGVHAFFLTRFPSLGIKTFLLFFVFEFLISNDSLIFCLWYCCSFDKVLGFIQLNYPWHSRQCLVPSEISYFLLKLSCWCSVSFNW